MLVPKALEKTYSHKQDGEQAWVTGKVRHSPYGPWGPGYGSHPSLVQTMRVAQSHPSMAAGIQDNRWGGFPPQAQTFGRMSI